MVGGYISVNVWIMTTIELTAKVKRRKVARSSGVSSALPVTMESHICKEGVNKDKSPTIRRRIPHYHWIFVNCICIFLYIYSNCVFCFSIWLHVFVCCGRLYIPFSRLHWSSLSYHTPWICPLYWCYVTLPAWAGIAVVFWHLFKKSKILILQ